MASSIPDSSSSSNGKSAIEDSSSSYFLHHSDGPGLVLVSQLLNGDNYTSWSRAMLIALSVKNKLGFVDGSIEKPDESDLLLLNSWIRNNNLVISWILNSVSKEISASIIFFESAAEIWLDLKERFSQSNGPRIFQLRHELINLAQDQQSVSVYFTKLKALWEELSNFCPICSCGKCTCGGVKELSTHYQMKYIMSFLMGLNESFAQVRGQLLLMDPLLAINKVFSSISQEERQRKVSSQSISAGDSNNSMAFVAKNEPVVWASNGSGNGHKYQKKDRPFCTHCNYHGYAIDKCYKIHGYPPSFRQRQRPQQSTTPPGMVNQLSTQMATNRNGCTNERFYSFVFPFIQDGCERYSLSILRGSFRNTYALS